MILDTVTLVKSKRCIPLWEIILSESSRTNYWICISLYVRNIKENDKVKKYDSSCPRLGAVKLVFNCHLREEGKITA